MEIKTYIQNTALIILLIIIQVKFSHLYSIFGIKPDILLVFLIRQSIKYPSPTRSLIRGFSAGILVDLLIGDVIGVSSLTYSVVSFATSYYKRDKGYLGLSNKITLFSIMFLLTSMIFYLMTLSHLPILKNIFLVALPSAIYGICIIWIIQIFKPIK
ncbi:MAG: rod shape-determining protein MreD [Candidatus Delongbacteria bacterium]|jgi:rod shape-determining protein MreD|nr:rod shape-determining protein MreD [Candidatus Delongbacteria bacterium]